MDGPFEPTIYLFHNLVGLGDAGSAVLMGLKLLGHRRHTHPYAGAVRAVGFTGLFCQISDPVDCRPTGYFWAAANRWAVFDGCRLFSKQVRGCGLGAMFARAAYCANGRARIFVWPGLWPAEIFGKQI